MKTIKKDEDILRVSNKDAEEKVKNEGWNYCPKSEYKKVRDSRPPPKKGKKGKKGKRDNPKWDFFYLRFLLG